MAQDGPTTDRLDSWKEIAAYVGRDVRTVIRWEQKGGLPVYRVPVGQRQAVYAFRHEIDEWMAGGIPGSLQLAAALEVAATRAGWNHDAGTAVLADPVAHSKPRSAWAPLREHSRIVAGSALIAVLAVIAFYSSFAPRRFVLDGETQITNDGARKRDLVTDGTWLYFSEVVQGRIALAKVSVHGGTVQRIPTSFIQAEPAAISPDGQKLLVLVREGEELEQALWVVPVDGRSPWRVGSVLCHDAAWAPDGRRIAFAFGNAIYTTADDGVTNRMLQTFSGIPFGMRWSLDGRRILFRLRDSTWSQALWELTLSRGGDDPHVVSITPLGLKPGEVGAMSVILDREDDVFLGVRESIFALVKRRLPWQSGFTLIELAGVKNGALAADPRGQRLFATRAFQSRDELYWFDRKSHEFRPFLADVSAYDVDFSPDGRRIVYVSQPRNDLWVSAADGSSPRQLPIPKMTVLELPRWSPDGKRITFMGRRANAPYRIFITTPEGGPLLEASHGTDNQGAPTWSPDGKHLAYGRVLCQEERTCAIQEIDLRTGFQTVVPGSDGLSTARWSHDGRFIAALRSDKHQVWLLSVQTGRWRKIADGVNGDDLAWSPDSRTIYASRPNGDRPEVVQISLPDGKVTDAVDLSEFSKLPGEISTWFGVTADDSILFLRISGGTEIFGFHYSER